MFYCDALRMSDYLSFWVKKQQVSSHSSGSKVPREVKHGFLTEAADLAMLGSLFLHLIGKL